MPAAEIPPAASAVFGAGLPIALRYVDLLAGPGTERGLIGPREGDRLWSRHVLNSAVVAQLLGHEPATVVDVGSGAGLPGIPLAIVRPDCAVVLVEPLERRAAFLSEVVAELGLTNCTVLRARAEHAIAAAGGADVVVSRAVAPLGKLAGWCAPLLRAGGLMLALKGDSAAEEITRDAHELLAAGLVQVHTRTSGEGLIDPPTTVVLATRDQSRSPVNGRIRKPAVRRPLS